VSNEPLEDDGRVYEQFPEQFHKVAHVLRIRRIEPGTKARLTELLTDADELFTGADTTTVTGLVALAGSRETAHRRLRLLLTLDAMMLWRPDAVAQAHDEWWAVDDGTRAALADLEVPDLLVHRKGSEDGRS
jgi:hypothetical protein